MQIKFLNKFNKQILNIFILFSLILAISVFVPQLNNKSYATTYTYSNSIKELPNNFESIYPNYKSYIDALLATYPAWVFKLYETNLEWETVINNEYLGHGSSPKNLVPSNCADGWICPICGKRPYDTGRWYCASRGAIEHMMDPRNGMNETYVFQFQDLSSTTGDRLSIEKMVSGTFIEGNTECIEAIFDASETYKVSPYHLVSRIIQEQSREGSVLSFGEGYDFDNDGIKEYVGLYNLFNIGASGRTKEEVIKNGLNKAKEKGWTSMALSIKGGAEAIVKNYISAGQNTIYFQKFNVINKDDLFKHQYMQNILAARGEGIIMKDKYKASGILDDPYTFLIPLYKNMPQTPVPEPQPVSIEGDYAYVNVDTNLILRDSPRGNVIGCLDRGNHVVITKLATEESDYYHQVYTRIGTGYMAKGSSQKDYLVIIGYKGNNYILKNEYMVIAPGIAVDGIVNNSATFGTGAEVTFQQKPYKLAILGDTNGDGDITPADYVIIKNRIMGARSLDSLQEIAANVNQDGDITPADYVKVKNHIMKDSSISISI